MNADYLRYFFDFEKCWTEIIGDYKFEDDGLFDIELMDDIEDKQIVNFIMNQIPMHNEECGINNGVLMFCFSEEYQTANESNNQKRISK